VYFTDVGHLCPVIVKIESIMKQVTFVYMHFVFCLNGLWYIRVHRVIVLTSSTDAIHTASRVFRQKAKWSSRLAVDAMISHNCL